MLILCFLVISSTKRTSSSSGFSSARSERSDSSNSLSNEPKPVLRYVKFSKNIFKKKFYLYSFNVFVIVWKKKKIP